RILQGSVFSLPIERAGHAYVLGGGHVAQALVPLLSKLDFSPVVYDDREEFASKALVPDAEKVICAPFECFSSLLCVRTCDRLVIMTRGHAYDHAVLVQALRTPACYIGLIGSKNKIAHTKALLLEQGFTQSDFARVHTPIGLPIKAQTPMEIAVSVAAEMILDRATQQA
ncbi:MAG: XdhC/CoxI family protein, partial [Clostridia bacterium]|nr:XdhC/CoxI family protein [Clostridia bacterium]